MIGPLNGVGPLYKQVYMAIREAILTGKMPAGTLIPTSRQLTQQLGISRTTILNAYADLVAEGYVKGTVGVGTVVSDTVPEDNLRALVPTVLQLKPYGGRSGPHRAEGRPGHASSGESSCNSARPRLDVDFGRQNPSLDQFPTRLWSRLSNRHLLRDFTQTLPPQGSLPLREGIAAYLVGARGVQCNAHQIVITNGVQQALYLTARILLGPRDVVAIEEAHYLGARGAFLTAGVQLVPVAVDQDGIKVRELSKLSAKMRVKLVYITPSHQMPTGAILSLERRAALADWATRNRCYVVEDDFDSEYRYEGRPIQAVQGIAGGENVIYVGSFSQSISPAIRLGFVVPPASLVPEFREAKCRADGQCGSLIQSVLADFIGEGHFEHHIRRARARNFRRRRALVDAFAKEFGNSVKISGADAGAHILARFAGWDAAHMDVVTSRAIKMGVRVCTVAPYFLGPTCISGLVLRYGALRDESIRRGVQLLRQALLSPTCDGVSVDRLPARVQIEATN